MGCLIEIRRIPDDSSVDSLDLGSDAADLAGTAKAEQASEGEIKSN